MPENGDPPQPGHGPGKDVGPVMLALSTFRRSDEAVRIALDRAAECGRLIVLYVADVNLARYMVGTDIGLSSGLERQCEEEVVAEHERDGQRHVAEIEELAREAGIAVDSDVRIGRFGLVVMEIARRERPSLIVTTRSERPAWVRRFFGSPVDHIMATAECPVIES
jgi:nucleotide-binding universal stress UspA family protein